MADGVAIGLRALAYASALLAAGVPIFVWLFGGHLDRSIRSIRSSATPLTAAALALTVGHAVVEPVRLAGEWSGILDRSLQSMLLGSNFGTTVAMRVLGLVLIAAGSRRAGRYGEAFAVIGATLIAVSFTFMGHTAADAERWLLAPLLFIHLIAIGFWFGSLWPLVTVTRFEDAAVAGAVIERFSRMAVRAVPLILLAGLAMAGLLLPDLSSLGTPYGLSLITKLAVFAIVMALAALNKWRLAPGISLGNPFSLAAFRISVLAEWLLILGVITVTAVMTALFSPDH